MDFIRTFKYDIIGGSNMKKKIKEKERARELRKEGLSLKQISEKIGVSKSSVSVWVSDIDTKWNGVSGFSREIEKLKIKYLENPKVCLFCKKDLPYRKRNNKYCDNKCRGESRRKKRRMECMNCNGEINIWQKKFCSVDCGLEYDWNQKIKKAQETGVTTRSPFSSKKLILKMRGHKCEVCKREDWEGVPIPLVLDHINGDCNDWRLDNLQLVCGNCDMLLPTYKSKNKNSGRKFRKKYYQKVGK